MHSLQLDIYSLNASLFILYMYINLLFLLCSPPPKVYISKKKTHSNRAQQPLYHNATTTTIIMNISVSDLSFAYDDNDVCVTIKKCHFE